MEVRIQRTVSVQPKYVREFMKAALAVSEHTAKVMGVESEVFYTVHKASENADFRIFTDFESMAQYEKVFLEKLLLDSKYLKLAEKAAEMITDEPLDELFVRLRPDDYFMNLRSKSRPTFEFEKVKKDKGVKPRYRREREYCASKGRLREVMQMNFAFMQDYYRAGGTVPNYFCTRFSVERIGCSKMYFDFDECPMCGPAFLEQDHTISTQFEGLLLTRPIDTLYMRVTPQDVNFKLSAVKR